MTQVRVLAFFVLLSLFPLQHNFDYHFRITRHPLDGEFLLALLFLLTLSWLAWRYRSSHKPAAFAWLWFLIALAPTNSLVPFKDFVAERHLYFALMGLALFLASLASNFNALPTKPWLARGSQITTALFLILLSSLTIARNHVLAHPLELWRQTTLRSPRKARPHLNYGILLLRSGQLQKGARHLHLADRLKPKNAETYYNLGVLYERLNQSKRALTYFRKSFELRRKKSTLRSLAKMHNRLGRRAYGQGRIAAAIGHFQEALRRDPSYRFARFNLTICYVKQRRFSKARSQLTTLLASQPQHHKARAWLHKLQQMRPPSSRPLSPSTRPLSPSSPPAKTRPLR